MLVIELGLFARDTLGVKVREDMPCKIWDAYYISKWNCHAGGWKNESGAQEEVLY